MARAEAAQIAEDVENTGVLEGEALSSERPASGEEDEPATTRATPKPAGPADVPDHGFAEIPHNLSRKAALAEYRRTVEEFRQTGALHEKEWENFAHLTNPPNLQLLVHDAHCQAVAAIEEWQEDEEERHRIQESQARREAEGRERDEARPVADIREWEAFKQRGPKDDEYDLPQLARPPAPEPPPPPPLPQLRGVEFDAYAPSKLYSYQDDGPLLNLERPDEPALPTDLETEAMLRAMIGECHFLMREVSFRSMCQARVLEDRRDWVETSMKLAKTGASVAKAIGRLRHGPSVTQTHHHTTITKVVAAAQVGGGGNAIP